MGYSKRTTVAEVSLLMLCWKQSSKEAQTMEPISAALAKATGKAATGFVKRESEGFIKAVVGGPAKATGSLFALPINERLFRNLAHATVKAKRILSELGLSPREVPLSIIHPMLQAASLEEDPDLQGVWANLLANAADPRELSPLAPSFATILKDLTAREAKFLNGLYLEARRIRRRKHDDDKIHEVKFSDTNLFNVFSTAGLARCPRFQSITAADWMNPELQADMRDLHFSMDLFKRHEIVVQAFEMPVKEGKTNVYKLGIKHSLSHLGRCFIEACREPNSAIPPSI
jgi:Abortive infection alpha